jgi:hypothetical protein
MDASEELKQLEDELIEVKMEIRRQLKAFEQIHEVLDNYDASMTFPGVLIKEIRSILE